MVILYKLHGQVWKFNRIFFLKQ